MKKKLNYLLIFFFLFLTINTKLFAENVTIAFVDIDKIIATSNAGKKIQGTFNKTINAENEKFSKTEKDLKKKEDEIIKQKNVLSKEELDKKIKDFQKEIQDFRNKRAKFTREMTAKNLETTNKMVNEINKILTKYASENSISIVIQKKNIIIGKSELDITDNILKEFNSKIKSIK
tara:strand:- start:2065 stop:2592 length:528 start_codon:yes stop_codon:yes gene_type:complete